MIFNALASTQTPEAEAAEIETKKKVAAALAKLPANYRKPVVLIYLHGKSYRAVSGLLQVRIQTLGVQLYRGKQILAKLLIKEGLRPAWNRMRA